MKNSAHVSHKLSGAKRLGRESFKNYKDRLRKEKVILKNYMKGEIVWYPGGKKSMQMLLYLATSPSAKEQGMSIDITTAEQVYKAGKGTLKGEIKGLTPDGKNFIRGNVNIEAKREIS